MGRTRAPDESIRGVRGWKDAHPGALVEVYESSLAAPVAAVVGVVPGAASPAPPGAFRDALQHPTAAVTGPDGGLRTLDILLFFFAGAFSGSEAPLVFRGGRLRGGLGCRHGPVGAHLADMNECCHPEKRLKSKRERKTSQTGVIRFLS